MWLKTNHLEWVLMLEKRQNNWDENQNHCVLIRRRRSRAAAAAAIAVVQILRLILSTDMTTWTEWKIHRTDIDINFKVEYVPVPKNLRWSVQIYRSNLFVSLKQNWISFVRLYPAKFNSFKPQQDRFWPVPLESQNCANACWLGETINTTRETVVYNVHCFKYKLYLQCIVIGTLA